MSISCSWDSQAAVWRFSTQESFELSDVVALVDRGDWDGRRRYLWDLRVLVRGPASTPELHQAVNLVKKTEALWAGGRVAILVERDLDFGIGRMFQAFTEEIDVAYRVFRDEALALAWLHEAPEG